MLSTFIPGSVFLVLGLAMFLHRETVAKNVENSQQRTLGRAMGKTPQMKNIIGAAAVTLMLMGLGLLAATLFLFARSHS